jgi:glycyl-tRNA synthetase beta chain
VKDIRHLRQRNPEIDKAVNNFNHYEHIMSTLLFEIGTEEIPAGFLQPALTQFQDNFTKKASESSLAYGRVRAWGTPRRLVLMVEDLADRQPDIREEIMGPSAKAGLDADGKPTKAAQGFARSKGAEVSDLKVISTDKGEYLVLVREVLGKVTRDLLPGMLKQLVLEFSFPKSMKWGSNTNTFARPIQWLLALYNNSVVAFEYDGIISSNTTRGHRFMANKTFVVDSFAGYEEQMRKAYVLVDPEKRRKEVVLEISQAAGSSDVLADAHVAIDEELVDTVTNLVEYPYGVCGTFDQKFLQVPDDVLITSMREHQKYFPVRNSQGKLLPGFVAVNNTRVKDTAITRKGHERVLRARLEDALFFFNTDKGTLLDKRIKDLNGIIFQAKLGTMLEKTERIVKLTRILAEMLAPESIQDACRAAVLSKADLLTNMVGEFPSLQGTMGEAYAALEGENPTVVQAIREHYMPKRAGAELPKSDAGAIVGLADRMDTIAGCFGIGQTPTGTTDPFGLRRLALAILYIIEDRGYTLSLREIVHKALALYGDKVDGGSPTVDSILAFMKGRYVNNAVAKGLDAGAVEAVTSVAFDDVNDCADRIAAFINIRKEEAFDVLASSFKRIRNITRENLTTDVDPAVFEKEAESRLHQLFGDVATRMRTLIADRRYFEALQVMLQMKEPVDTFFDEVMVMADDAAVRRNRLNLLTAIGELILQVGDISKMQQG